MLKTMRVKRIYVMVYIAICVCMVTSCSFRADSDELSTVNEAAISNSKDKKEYDNDKVANEEVTDNNNSFDNVTEDNSTESLIPTERKCTEIDCLKENSMLMEEYYYYDSAGNITSTKSYYYNAYKDVINDNATIVYDQCEYTYDEKNRMVFEKKTDSRKNYTETTEYVYDTNGNLIKQTDTDYSGSQQFQEWFYDSNGLLNTYTRSNIEGVYTYSSYCYENGKLMTVYCYNKNYNLGGYDLLDVDEYTYNGEELKRVDHKDSDGNLTDYTEYFYEDDILYKTVNNHADGDLLVGLEYDQYGNIIKREAAYSYSSYSYDSNNNVIELISYNHDGDMSQHIKYVWEDIND